MWPGYTWFSHYVIAAMLVDEKKRFLISSFSSSMRLSIVVFATQPQVFKSTSLTGTIP